MVDRLLFTLETEEVRTKNNLQQTRSGQFEFTIADVLAGAQQ